MTATTTISSDVRREIEIRAYHIWEREGRPQGREHAHWLIAEAEVLGAKPAKKAARVKSTAEVKTKAGNGESAPAPKPTKAADTRKPAFTEKVKTEKGKAEKTKKAAKPRAKPA